MAGTKFTNRDLNRFRKVYRYIRKKPKNKYISDKPVTIESYYLDFDGSTTSQTYTFSQGFSSAPNVTATSVDNLSNSQADINVFITSITTTQVTIEISSLAECRVHFHAIYIEC